MKKSRKWGFAGSLWQKNCASVSISLLLGRKVLLWFSVDRPQRAYASRFWGKKTRRPMMGWLVVWRVIVFAQSGCLLGVVAIFGGN